MSENNFGEIENFETEQELKEKAKNMVKIPISLEGIKYILKLYLSEEKNSIIFKLEKERILTYFYFEKFFLHDFRQKSRIFMIDYTITQILSHMKKLIIKSEIAAEIKDENNMIIIMKSTEENKYLLNFELKKVILAQNQLNLRLDEQVQENKAIIKFLNAQIEKLTKVVQTKNEIIKNFNNNITTINKSINDINIITNNIINNNNKKEEEEKNINIPKKPEKKEEKKEKETIKEKEKEKEKEETLKKTENNPPPKKEEVNNNKTKNNSEIEDKRYISNNRKKKNKKKNKKFFHGDNQNKNNQNTNKNPDDNNIFCFENVEIIGNKKIFELLVVFNVIMILIILCLIGSIYSIKSNIEYERVLEDEFMNKLSYLNVINDYGDDDYIPKMGGGDWDPNDILFENEQQKAYFKEEIISRENKKIKDVEFILRHKSSRDGKNFETFFNNCKGVEENLLLIRNEKGQKFALLSKNLIDVLRGNKVKESQVKKNFIMYNFNKHDIFEYNFSRNFEEIYSSFIKNIFNFFSEKGEYEDSRLKFIGRIVEIEIYELKFIK